MRSEIGGLSRSGRLLLEVGVGALVETDATVAHARTTVDGECRLGLVEAVGRLRRLTVARGGSRRHDGRIVAKVGAASKSLVLTRRGDGTTSTFELEEKKASDLSALATDHLREAKSVAVRLSPHHKVFTHRLLSVKIAVLGRLQDHRLNLLRTSLFRCLQQLDSKQDRAREDLQR